MKGVNHKQLSKFMHIAYVTKTPLYIWGTMGIGKSQNVRDSAKAQAEALGLEFSDSMVDSEKAFCFIDVRISQLDPSDIRGLPSVDGDATKWLPPSWLPSNPKSKGVLFLDELNLAPPAMQAAAYQLILDRKIGEYRLPDGWLVVAAGNTSDDRANIFELPAPLANRFIHLELRTPTKEEWTEWGLHRGDIMGSIISFLELRPAFLYSFNRKSKDRSFATPRTWAYVNKLLKGAKSATLEEIETLVASAVGEGIATEFVAYLKLQKQINLDEILDKPETVKSIRTPDLKYSLIGALVEKYREDAKDLGKVVNVTLHLDPEFAILLLRYLKQARPNTFVKEAIKLQAWDKVFKAYGKYLMDLREG
jgi:hypothetical protein